MPTWLARSAPPPLPLPPSSLNPLVSSTPVATNGRVPLHKDMVACAYLRRVYHMQDLGDAKPVACSHVYRPVRSAVRNVRWGGETLQERLPGLGEFHPYSNPHDAIAWIETNGVSTCITVFDTHDLFFTGCCALYDLLKNGFGRAADQKVLIRTTDPDLHRWGDHVRALSQRRGSRPSPRVSTQTRIGTASYLEIYGQMCRYSAPPRAGPPIT